MHQSARLQRFLHLLGNAHLREGCRERHVPDLVLGIDDPHQIECAVVHGMQVDTSTMIAFNPCGKL